MAVEFPQVLSAQGGTLLQRVGSVFAEKLKLAKTMDAGGIGGGMLSGLLSGGLASIAMNPIAAITGQLQSAITSAIPDLTSGGFTSLVTSLTGAGGLQSATSNIASLVGGIAGTSAVQTGYPSNLDVQSHGNNVDLLGTSPPAQYAMSTVLAPLYSTSTLTNITADVTNVLTEVLAGTITEDAAVAVVSTHTETIAGLTAGSVGAVSGLQAVLPTLASANAIGAALVSGDPDLQAALALIVQPDALAALKAAAVAMTTIDVPTITTTAPLLNLDGVLMQWIADHR